MPPLRGSGSQSHSQENGEFVGITNTMHTSGAVGEIQGDAARSSAWYFNSVMLYQSDMIYYDEPYSRQPFRSSTKYPGFYVYRRNGVTSGVWVDDAIDHSESDSGNFVIPKETWHPMHMAYYRYKPIMTTVTYGGDDDSPGTSIDVVTGLEEYIDDNSELLYPPYGTIYWNKSFIAGIGHDTSFDTPTDNEIRPVNTAVRYFIRAR